jgi:hypothetical protein
MCTIFTSNSNGDKNQFFAQNFFLQKRMIRIVAVAVLLLLEAVLSHPFNLDLINFKNMDKFSKFPPFVNAMRPQFSHQQFSPQQFSPSQRYSAAVQQQYNPEDYLADPLGSFPVCNLDSYFYSCRS